MLTTILNMIGILCIIISVAYIKRTLKEERGMYEDVLSIRKDIEYYYSAIENTLNSFNDLIEISLNKMDVLQMQDIEDIDLEESTESIKKNTINILDEPIKKDFNIKDINIKIFELKESGLSNEQIAKKLNKSVREVDIIIKVWSNFYKKY